MQKPQQTLAQRLLLPTALAVSPAAADERPAAVLEELVVYGRAEAQIGQALTASEGLVGYDDLRLPPLLRVGELAEVVPGMVATQHSATGKANQYFLRGFNLDHGTDFSAFADGVPLNMRTHGHGHGYLDLNFLIPETVATAAYRKGPYHASDGDFSSAGSVRFGFHERLPDTQASLTIGADGYRRGLLSGSRDAGTGVVTGAVDATRYDGPWEMPEDLGQDKLYLAYALPVGQARARVTLQGYRAEWQATDQIPLRAVRAGLISDRGFIDPDLGGEASRYALTGALAFDAWEVTGYVVTSDLTLFSNFTYLLDDPEAGDQFEQRDDRRIYGANVSGGTTSTLGGWPVDVRWGGDVRYDDIDAVGLYATTARQRNDVVRQDAVTQWSAGAYGEAELHVTDRLRASAGLRGDHFDWDVTAFQPENGGSDSDALVTPKLGLAYRFNEGLEGYANWGRGFHSNDVRGATITLDPQTGDPADPVSVFARSTGAELGLRLEHGQRWNATLAAFRLELDSELVFEGDSGTTAPNDGSRRRGVEASVFWQPNHWLALNADYTFTHARFEVDQEGGGRRIPGAVASTFSLGANAVWGNGFSASARARYLGKAPLNEDNSVRSSDSLLVHAGAAWRRGPLEVRVDGFNLLDSDEADIAYFYASRLPEEPAEGVEDVHFHPLEPRSFRGTVAWHW